MNEWISNFCPGGDLNLRAHYWQSSRVTTRPLIFTDNTAWVATYPLVVCGPCARCVHQSKLRISSHGCLLQEEACSQSSTQVCFCYQMRVSKKPNRSFSVGGTYMHIFAFCVGHSFSLSASSPFVCKSLSVATSSIPLHRTDGSYDRGNSRPTFSLTT